jgi:hypothetical protein
MQMIQLLTRSDSLLLQEVADGKIKSPVCTCASTCMYTHIKNCIAFFIVFYTGALI